MQVGAQIAARHEADLLLYPAGKAAVQQHILGQHYQYWDGYHWGITGVVIQTEQNPLHGATVLAHGLHMSSHLSPLLNLSTTHSLSSKNLFASYILQTQLAASSTPWSKFIKITHTT